MSFVAIDVYPLFNSPLEQARKPRSYASSKLRACHLLTGVKCRATSVAKIMFLGIGETKSLSVIVTPASNKRVKETTQL